MDGHVLAMRVAARPFLNHYAQIHRFYPVQPHIDMRMTEDITATTRGSGPCQMTT